jgi:VanZ family protein
MTSSDRKSLWPSKILALVSYLCLMGVIALMFYFGLRSSPRMAEITWLPHWFGKLADEFDTFRHFAGFAALAATTFFMPLVVGLQRSPKAKEAFRDWALLTMLVMVAAMEIAQLWIPTRHFDWEDMYWGWAGALSARFALDTARRVRRWVLGWASAVRGRSGAIPFSAVTE